MKKNNCSGVHNSKVKLQRIAASSASPPVTGDRAQPGCGLAPCLEVINPHIESIWKRYLILLIITLLLGNPAVAKNVATANQVQLPIPIFVSIGPHLNFCQEIGGDRVSVEILLPPGKSPATYAPTPKQIQILSRSQLFFKVGLPFETTLLAKIIALPKHPQIIDTQAGITLQPMQHEHHQHSHSNLDPHSWLDPRLAFKQATTIAAALSHIDPNGKDLYINNLNILKEKLNVLHLNITKTLEPFAGNPLFVYHPAFGYFAKAYKLHQIAIEFGGKRPKSKELAKFIKRAREEKSQVIFVQPQFDQKSAQKIANALNCAVIPLDPLAQDYYENLNYIADTIRKKLKKEK